MKTTASPFPGSGRTVSFQGTSKARPTEADLSGRDRLLRNVVASWAGHLIFIFAGFVLPRMIDRQIGQTELGIWDFSWSVVNYFGMAGLGIGSSVNRYVAKYRGTQDTQKLRTAVSSVFIVQLIASIMIAGLTGAATWAIPVFFSDRLGGYHVTAQYVVLLLGLSLAVQMAFDTFRGIITGCHRWDVHNGLNAGAHALTVGAMIWSMLQGGRLISLSAVYLCGSLLTELIRVFLAFRICPAISIRFKYFSRRQAWAMLKFGIKGIVAGIAYIVIFQATSILIASHMGPAALAVFSRPASLVRVLENMIAKFAMVLTPTAGSLQSTGQLDELQRLFLQSARIGVFLTLPGVIFLIFLGGPILEIWMGAAYGSGMIVSILAVGFFLPISLQSVFSILTGMNRHGRVGLVSSLVSIFIFTAGAWVLTLTGWNLDNASVLLAISFSAGIGVVRPVYGCLQLKIPIKRFVSRAILPPLACGLPFAACLGINRVFIIDRPVVSTVVGLVTAAVILGPLYWRYVVPDSKRITLRSWIRIPFTCRAKPASNVVN
jgi:O-antigen/teichoic acid export membrane protein